MKSDFYYLLIFGIMILSSCSAVDLSIDEYGWPVKKTKISEKTWNETAVGHGWTFESGLIIGEDGKVSNIDAYDLYTYKHRKNIYLTGDELTFIWTIKGISPEGFMTYHHTVSYKYGDNVLDYKSGKYKIVSVNKNKIQAVELFNDSYLNDNPIYVLVTWTRMNEQQKSECERIKEEPEISSPFPMI